MFIDYSILLHFVSKVSSRNRIRMLENLTQCIFSKYTKLVKILYWLCPKASSDFVWTFFTSLFEFTKHVSLLSINNHPLFPLPNHTSFYSSTHLSTWANMSLKETWYSGRTRHIDVLSSWVWINFTMNVIIIAFIIIIYL